MHVSVLFKQGYPLFPERRSEASEFRRFQREEVIAVSGCEGKSSFSYTHAAAPEAAFPSQGCKGGIVLQTTAASAPSYSGFTGHCIHRRAAAACFGLVTPPDSLPDLRTYCAKAERQDAPNFQARFKHHHQGARRRRIRGMTPLTVCRNTVPSESPTYTCPPSASAMLTPSEPPTLPEAPATPDAMV